jgi:hypothetical protein
MTFGFESSFNDSYLIYSMTTCFVAVGQHVIEFQCPKVLAYCSFIEPCPLLFGADASFT